MRDYEHNNSTYSEPHREDRRLVSFFSFKVRCTVTTFTEPEAANGQRVNAKTFWAHVIFSLAILRAKSHVETD